MQKFVIGANDSGQRIDKFLLKAVPNLPVSLMYKYIRLKRIKVNGKRCSFSDKLKTGDIVELYINDEFFERPKYLYDFLDASSDLDIVYEDENIMILNKKAGLLVHPSKREKNNTLISYILRYLYDKGEYNPDKENSFAPSLVNRIDRNTQGLILAAKNAMALRILNQKMRSREIKKHYICIVHGIPEKKQDTLKGYLYKNNQQNRAYIHQNKICNSKLICTRYKVLDVRDNLCLMEVELLTGRTHQIRAHLASIGHPILGDPKYGRKVSGRGTGYTSQALCSYKLTFDFNSDAGILNYLNKKTFKTQNIDFVNDFYSGATLRKEL